MNGENEEKCCVCGKQAHDYHMSIFGQIKFWVCKKHHQKTRPAIGPDGEYNRMGLVDYDTREWVDLKHWKENKNA